MIGTEALVNSAGNAALSRTDKASASLAESFDDFILILAAQLKNQDPTEPLDPNEFTQQIVSMTGVGQQIDTNKNLEGLVSLIQSSQVGSTVAYIGKEVEIEGNKIQLQQGNASIQYDLGGTAEKVDVVISDNLGRVVYIGEGGTQVGRNTVTWDGTGSLTGTQQADGVYKVQIKARGAQDEEVPVTSYMIGKVTAVNMQNETPLLAVGDVEVPLDKVRVIREATKAVIPEPDEAII